MKKSRRELVEVFVLVGLAAVSIGCGEGSDPVGEDGTKSGGGSDAASDVAVRSSSEAEGSAAIATPEIEKVKNQEPELVEATGGQADDVSVAKVSGIFKADETDEVVSVTETVDASDADSSGLKEDEGAIGAESEIAAARVRAKQKKEVQVLLGLGKAFRTWSLDRGGKYPPTVDHPEFAALLGRPEVFKFKNAITGEVARPWYMKGASAESLASEIVLASPWVYRGKRAVVYCNSRGEALAEEKFQAKVAEAIKKGGRELVK